MKTQSFRKSLSLFLVLAFAANTVFAADPSAPYKNGIEQRNQRLEAARQEAFKLNEANKKTIGSRQVVPVNATYDKMNPELLFPMPNKMKALALHGEQFGTGTVGFMIGSIMECFTRAELSHDQMILNACVDSLRDANGWIDLMVFSAGSQGTAMALKGLLDNRSFEALKVFRLQSTAVAVSRFFTSPMVLNYGGMIIGSIVQHFYVKYRTSEELKARKTADTEWGYWVEKKMEFQGTVRQLSAILENKDKTMTTEQRLMVGNRLNEYTVALAEANERIQKYRSQWWDGLGKSIQKIYTIDEKERQELFISTGQMLAASGLLAGGHKVFNMVMSKSVSDATIKSIGESLSGPEQVKIAQKYRGVFERLSKSQQRQAIAMVYRDRYVSQTATTVFRQIPGFMKLEKYAQKNPLEQKYMANYWNRVFVMKTNGAIDIISPYSMEIGTGRKLFLTSSALGKKVGTGLFHSAWMAFWFLLTSKQIGEKYTEFGYNHSLPYKPAAKYLKLYKLEDRIEDARVELYTALDAVLKDDAKNAPSPQQAMVKKLVEQKKQEYLDEAKKQGVEPTEEDLQQFIIPPEKLNAFKEAVAAFDGVFKMYREEVVLREFNEHFKGYSDALDKRDTEEYSRLRYVKWFARGGKYDDRDFNFNGTEIPEVLEKYKSEMQDDESSELFGERPGKKWHLDPNETQGSFFNEVKEMKKALKDDGLDVETAKPADYEKYIKAYKAETARMSEKLSKDFQSQLTEFMEKLIPSDRKNVGSKTAATPLETSYELEYFHFREIVKTLAFYHPGNQMLAQLKIGVLAADQKNNGTSFANPTFDSVSSQLIPIVEQFDNAYVASEYEKSANDRLTLMAGQLFLVMRNLNTAYDRVPAQKELVLGLDLNRYKRCGEFNKENSLENKFVKQTEAERMRNDNAFEAVNSCFNQ